MKKNKFKPVKGFNRNKKTGHVSYAYYQKGNNVKSLGFTHNDDKRYGKLSKLKRNIDPTDTEDCYVKHNIENYKSNFYKYDTRYKDYRIHKLDKPLIDSIIKNNSFKKKKKR